MKQNGQDPRSYSLYFHFDLWFRARKVTGTFEKRAPGQSWILDSTVWISDSIFQDWIPIVNGIPDSLSCIRIRHSVSKIFSDSGFPYMGRRGVNRTKNSEDVLFLVLSAINYKSPKIRRLSTVSSVVAAAGHVFSTRWHWYWHDENNKWQSYDTPTDGHAVNTTSSQCLEREYMAGRKFPFPLIYYNQFLVSHIYFKPFVLFGG